MREIKFRAWNTVDKTMGGSFTLQDAIGSRKLNGIDTSEVEYMQYTGLKDKNGKEIYECDIYKHSTGQLYQVLFSNGAFCGGKTIDSVTPLNWDVDEDNTDGLVVDDWSEQIEVVGNVYEHPHLLNHEGK